VTRRSLKIYLLCSVTTQALGGIKCTFQTAVHLILLKSINQQVAALSKYVPHQLCASNVTVFKSINQQATFQVPTVSQST
jgi:hypothetical protein